MSKQVDLTHEAQTGHAIDALVWMSSWPGSVFPVKLPSGMHGLTAEYQLSKKMEEEFSGRFIMMIAEEDKWTNETVWFKVSCEHPEDLIKITPEFVKLKLDVKP